MEINERKIERLAELSNLRLTQEEVKKLQKDAQKIVDFFDKLKEAEVQEIEVEANENVSEAVADKDMVDRRTGREWEQFRDKKGKYLRVPKVL